MRNAPGACLTTCSYGLSRLDFRGPWRPTDGGYLACLGGSETFARDVPHPFPELLEQETGTVCLNLGQQMAGPDLFLRDHAVRALVHDASAVVIQIMGAVNLSNRFYKVHPRRNDRFIAPCSPLRALYPEVDFTEIAFTGHLMARLAETDPLRVSEVRRVLRGCWMRRMRELVGLANGPVHLLWFAPRHPEDPADNGHDPSLVTPEMLTALEAAGTKVTQVVYDGSPGVLPQMPCTPDHRRAAAALCDAMGR
ncbi:DUF6473 family protein [Salibaculum sp.]|uniref:DUF6473 family protein n=1 Tax=Salibaculum sp. TaxID=2855480 RepID=UPI002B48E84E|nr:DUF6473 family protein [Salibaculum sp.]HKL68542.1 DUF6473 family protein [Salibaculum sp.]